ncbi:MAG: ThuA domain-containing protein [Verrucomicrobiales bacterium]|jgi:type 1 glutamine amidotransferase|nr:ThuA domain-containing protein [Verrucomicrobiales bacterium]
MKKALIVYGGWTGHEPVETAELLANLLTKEGLHVDRSDKLEVFEDADRLKTYDLIVPNWTMGALAGQQEGNLCAAVKAGTGIGGFHGGCGDAFRNNTEYQFMIGGQFVAHPDGHKDYTINLLAQTGDPLIAGLDDFQVHSEQYYMHIDPSNNVLATTTFHSTSAPWVNGTVIPVAWKRTYGAGRVFYQSFGHNAKELAGSREALELTRRGLLWATR